MRWWEGSEVAKQRTPSLPLVFYRAPATARTTLTLDQLQSLLLATDGRFRATDGTVWNLENVRLCPNVYEITARRVV